MRKPASPRMTSRELYREVGKRVHCPTRLVEIIVLTFEKVIIQCLLQKIRVPFGTLGTFGYKTIPPRDYVEWNGWTKEGEPVVFYRRNTNGYLKFYFHLNNAFRHQLKEIAIIPYGSVPSEEPNPERHPHSNIKIDYEEYYQKEKQEKSIEQNNIKIENTEDENEDEPIEDYEQYIEYSDDNDYSDYDDYEEYDSDDIDLEEGEN